MSDLIEQYRAIVENAPEGSATHYAEGCYLREAENGYDYCCPEYGWMRESSPQDFNSIQSLDNLSTIIAQHDRIAELERERDDFCQMIIDAESAEPNVRALMYPVFLHKAKQLRKGANND